MPGGNACATKSLILWAATIFRQRGADDRFSSSVVEGLRPTKFHEKPPTRRTTLIRRWAVFRPCLGVCGEAVLCHNANRRSALARRHTNSFPRKCPCAPPQQRAR